MLFNVWGRMPPIVVVPSEGINEHHFVASRTNTPGISLEVMPKWRDPVNSIHASDGLAAQPRYSL
jgi:hypothetical protein